MICLAQNYNLAKKNFITYFINLLLFIFFIYLSIFLYFYLSYMEKYQYFKSFLYFDILSHHAVLCYMIEAVLYKTMNLYILKLR